MNDATPPLIHLQKVTKVFLTDEIETHALESVDLEIRNGEYVAISGPSGSWLAHSLIHRSNEDLDSSK